MTEVASFLSADDIQAAGQGPLYVKLQQALAGAIRSGRLKSGDALPPERDLAEYASISRVTVRKAVDELVRQGILVRRHGSGTFVAKPVEKVEQPLSRPHPSPKIWRAADGPRGRNGSSAASSRHRRTK
jgi:GntR family transcriptional regulator